MGPTMGEGIRWPHSGFHVHLGPVIHEDEGELLKTTALYCARAPLSLSRLRYDRETGAVSYEYTTTYDRTESTERITPPELIARLATHIPDPGEHTLKYFAWYANRSQEFSPSSRGRNRSKRSSPT